MQNRLKIGFLSAHDPNDRLAWSGIIHYIATSLEKHAGEIVSLGPAFTGREELLHLWDLKARTWFGKGYNFHHSLYQSMGFACVFNARLQQNPVDVIFAPVASTEIAMLKTRTPIVYLSDTTFSAVSGYYPLFSEFLAISRFESNLTERLAIRKATHLIYPSQWAADSAIRDYGACSKKVHVFSLGANIDTPPSREDLVARRRSESIRLLFIGVDWQRKGGSVAFDTLKALDEMGIKAHLTIVGCVPPSGFSHPAMTVIPFLSKNEPDDRARLSKLYLDSDIFILPTRAECLGVVFCEAAAFGLPVFASATGGVPSVIEDGKTGRLFPLDAEGADYANAIAELWQNPPRLNAMGNASRVRFDSHLNWDAWGMQAASVINAAARLNPGPDHPGHRA
jgi:glycosyltransferase involved in cell wall biosynthesis